MSIWLYFQIDDVHVIWWLRWSEDDVSKHLVFYLITIHSCILDDDDFMNECICGNWNLNILYLNS